MSISLAGGSAAATPAVAAEAPELTVQKIKASTAAFFGVLSPASPGEFGASYRFIYREAAACTGAGEVKTGEGMSFGDEHEELPAEPVEGLVAHKEYTVCLSVTNVAKTETTLSAPVHFTTATPPETPETKAATEITSTNATVNGVLNPNSHGEAGSYEFLYEQSASECDGTGHQTTSLTPAAGGLGEAAEAGISNLLPGTAYSFCVLASNEAGETKTGNVVGFTTLVSAPSIQASTLNSANESASSAELEGSFAPGGPTKYHFEYGTTTEYDSATPEETVLPTGSASTPVHVVAVLSGLSADTTYHWRLIASNEAGTAASVDHTFIYDTTASGTGACPNEALREQARSTLLPDCRAYEMVTPPEKNGGVVGTVFIGAGPDVADSGNRVISPSDQCFSEAQSCSADRANEADPFLFERTSTGWTTIPLTPPATAYGVNTSLAFNAETGDALFAIPTPPTGKDDLYGRESDSAIHDIGPTMPASSLGRLEPFGEEVKTTADLSHVLYDVSGSYHWPFDETLHADSYSLYEYAGTNNSEPRLVGVSGGAGSTSLISICGNHLGGGPAVSYRYNSVSEDGSVVFFTAYACEGGSGANRGVPVPANTLYARVEGSRTVLISGRSPYDCTTAECVSSTPAAAEFAGASADGSRVFFTSTQQLTNDATEGSQNLYEYDFARPEGENLRAISAGDSSGGGPQVEGVEAISSDGSHVYFAARGVLSPEANEYGQHATPGQVNLYVSESDASYPAGRTRFIAQLPPSDEEFILDGIEASGYVGGVGLQNTTPDGRYLVFISHGRLTPDDTSSNGEPQLFRYDTETGILQRLSVGENGFDDNGNAGRGGAMIVPVENTMFRAGTARSDPTMSNDGSYVFFESPIALTPRAVNDVQIGTLGGAPEFAQNIYEWHEGDVTLISDGKDISGISPVGGNVRPTEALSSVKLLGSDATGENVFFTTADQLVPQDTDTLLDYYDARIDGGFPYSPPASKCSGEACRGESPVPLSSTAPASSTFNGPGNLQPTGSPSVRPATPTRAERLAKALHACHRKHYKRKRVACEKQAQHKYGHAARATSDRLGNQRRAKG